MKGSKYDWKGELGRKDYLTESKTVAMSSVFCIRELTLIMISMIFIWRESILNIKEITQSVHGLGNCQGDPGCGLHSLVEN